MVSSRVYPSLERKPGGPDNWVERAGGLPSYIERIAKNLHYERGFAISRAIATAVNTVKRWAKGGTVTAYGTTKRISAATQALAAKSVAEWEAKRKAGKINLSDVEWFIIDATHVSDEFAIDLAEETSYLRDQKCKYCANPATKSILWAEGMAYIPVCEAHLEKGKGDVTNPMTEKPDPSEIVGIYDLETGRKIEMTDTAGAQVDLCAILASMNVKDLAARANAIEDPAKRAAARARVIEMTSGMTAEQVIDLASSIPPRGPGGRAKDGRPSFKKQGKWGHGFVPKDRAAKEAKAKGSPIAMKRMNRLFSGGAKPAKDAKPEPRKQKQEPEGRTGVNIQERGPGERASDVAHLRNTEFQDRTEAKGPNPQTRLEASKQGRSTDTAHKPWNEIPESQKTVRNGKRYVVAVYNGKQIITEWLGGVDEVRSTALNKRKTQKTLTTADAMNMTTAEIRQLLKNPNTSDEVKKVLNKALTAKVAEK